ncbi:MAG: hypothetical protein ACM3XM_16660 [Mycobacterium leprae]
MQPVHARSVRPGLPLFPMLLAIPVVLALGFVTGMGIATYGGHAAANAAANGLGTTTPGTGSDLSWMITPGTGTAPAQQPNVGTAAPDTTPKVTVQEPPFTGTPRDAREARRALATTHSQYLSDVGAISFDYQLMRQSESGLSIVGMISVDSYDIWLRALQTDPTRLNAWLSSAAVRVQPAAIQDPFHLSWAVVDVLRDRPTSFADSEVTPLDNRTYLIIRPLAATVDHTKTEVSIRPLESLAQAPHTGVGSATSPWAAYGPVLRFDATDLYLPARAVGAKPLFSGSH